MDVPPSQSSLLAFGRDGLASQTTTLCTHSLSVLTTDVLMAGCAIRSFIFNVQWNLGYPGGVGPRGARNFKIARNSELIHELCTWLYNTGHKYIKLKKAKIIIKHKK